MSMQSKVQRWGNSLAVRIPKAFAQDIGIEEDSSVEISVAEGGLMISPKAPRPFTLKQLLAGITDENLHEEISTGPALGNEAW
jgi:antitoxin MazE